MPRLRVASWSSSMVRGPSVGCEPPDMEAMVRLGSPAAGGLRVREVQGELEYAVVLGGHRPEAGVADAVVGERDRDRAGDLGGRARVLAADLERHRPGHAMDGQVPG